MHHKMRSNTRKFHTEKMEVQTAFSAAEVPTPGKWMEKLSRPSSHGGAALLCVYSMSH